MAHEMAASFPGVLAESNTSTGAPGAEKTPTSTTLPGTGRVP
jgi:hypothetical protein